MYISEADCSNSMAQQQLVRILQEDRKEFSTSTRGADISGVTETAVRQSDSFTSFAWQVNPVALRVGNHRIGGFLEAGLGTKAL